MISTHAPLAGRDNSRACESLWEKISTHAPLAGRDHHSTSCILLITFHFNPRAPCGARQNLAVGAWRPTVDFNPRAPCGARRARKLPALRDVAISTHAPLAGRDGRYRAGDGLHTKFQPTRPLRGATARSKTRSTQRKNFNPRAPCGARQQKCTNHYAHFCDNRQISDAFTQNAACQGILLLFDAGKPCGFWVRTAQVISAHLCFAL